MSGGRCFAVAGEAVLGGISGGDAAAFGGFGAFGEGAVDAGRLRCWESVRVVMGAVPMLEVVRGGLL